MIASLKLPRLSTNMSEGTIVSWLKAVGDTFAEGEPLYSVETEKVTADVEAPCSGALREICVPEGANVDVGTVVCRVETA